MEEPPGGALSMELHSPGGHKELDTTESLNNIIVGSMETHVHLFSPGTCECVIYKMDFCRCN